MISSLAEARFSEFGRMEVDRTSALGLVSDAWVLDSRTQQLDQTRVYINNVCLRNSLRNYRPGSSMREIGTRIETIPWEDRPSLPQMPLSAQVLPKELS